MGRQPCCDEKTGIKKGPWTAEEDRKLSNFMMLSSNGGYHACWKDVPQLAGLMRCGKSCRLRWINYLRPDLKRGNLSEEEEDLIIALHEKLGNRWSKIAAHLPGRTDNEIKNCWNTRIKRRLKKTGIDPATHRALLPQASRRQLQPITSGFQQAAGYGAANPNGSSSSIRVLRSTNGVVDNNTMSNILQPQRPNSAFKDYNATNNINARQLRPAMPIPISVMPPIQKTAEVIISSGVMLDGSSVKHHASNQSAISNNGTVDLSKASCDQVLYADAGYSVPPKVEQIAAPMVNYAPKLMLQNSNKEFSVNKSKSNATECGINVNSPNLDQINEASLQHTCKDSSTDASMQDVSASNLETLPVAPSAKFSIVDVTESMADSNNLNTIISVPMDSDQCADGLSYSDPINADQAGEGEIKEDQIKVPSDDEHYLNELQQYIPHEMDQSEESTDSSSSTPSSEGAIIISVPNAVVEIDDKQLWSPSCEESANENNNLQAIMMMELYNPWEDSLMFIEGQQINLATSFDDLGQELNMVQIQHSSITSSNNNSSTDSHTISNNNDIEGSTTVNIMQYPLWSSTTQLFPDELRD